VNISPHASRWLITLVLGPVLVWVLLWAPPPVFDAVVALAGLLAWREYFVISFGRMIPRLMVVASLGWLLIVVGAVLGGIAGQQAALFAAMCGGGGYFLLNYERIPSIIDHIGRFALGHLYLSLFLSFLIILFALEQGRQWVLFSLVVTFLADTAAFYVGRTWGRRFLYPAVSPKKTWEGLAGGFVGGGLTAAVMAVLLFPVAWYEAAVLGGFLGVWGTVGDLFESMLKRSVGIKDSGRILMGHGGVLDRVDALLFNVPIVYFFAITRGV